MVGPLALYHSGRLTSYAVIGFVVGLAGDLPVWNLAEQNVRGGLSLVAAIVLLISAVGIPLLPRVVHRWSWMQRLAAAHRKLSLAAGRRGRFGLGVANGFLPCGPVGAIALAAATSGSALLSAGGLVLFGLGTTPALALVAFGVGAIAPGRQIVFRRVATVLLVLLAFQLSMRGLAAFDVVAHRELASWMLW
jgi:sulfite exporter TauE/SafE